MMEIERGRPQAARAHCAALDRPRRKIARGQRAPVRVRARRALRVRHRRRRGDRCKRRWRSLRAADAKHRLAFTLTRAARLDLERQRPELAIAHASEALRCAEALDRPTEIVLAHVVLAQARRSTSDLAGYRLHVAALAGFEEAARRGLGARTGMRN